MLIVNHTLSVSITSQKLLRITRFITNSQNFDILIREFFPSSLLFCRKNNMSTKRDRCPTTTYMVYYVPRDNRNGGSQVVNMHRLT